MLKKNFTIEGQILSVKKYEGEFEDFINITILTEDRKKKNY